MDSSVLDFRVCPNDLDIYGHMNNGRYLTLMDLGRADWIWRTGLGRVARIYRWKPLVAASKIRYRKSLMLFQRFSLHTRIIGWDQKWFYLEQVFKKGERVVASASVRGLFRGLHGNIKPAEVLEAIHQSALSPELPDSIRLWIESEK